MKPQETVLRLSLFIDQRQYDAREFWMLVVEQTMRGEVHYLISAQFRTCRGRSACGKVERLQRLGLGSHGGNEVGLAPAEWQPIETCKVQITR